MRPTRCQPLLLLCLLALSQLAQPALGARRKLLLPQDQAEQGDRERAQRADQKSEQQSWEAQEMAKLMAQQRSEAAKLEEMAEEHHVREQHQEADQLEEAASKAQREDAAESEQRQLSAKAKEAAEEAEQAEAEEAADDAEEDAERAARKERKESRRAERKSRRAGKEAEQAGEGDASSTASSDAIATREVIAGSDGGSEVQSTTGGAPREAVWGLGGATGSGRKGEAGSAYATYHYYGPNYETSSLYCADKFNEFLPVGPDHWLLEYPWTAYCNIGGLGPMKPEYCGRCLKATNPATGQSVKLRVVDMCGQGGVDIDPLGFNAIDSNKAGVRDGHMWLDLEWC